MSYDGQRGRVDKGCTPSEHDTVCEAQGRQVVDAEGGQENSQCGDKSTEKSRPLNAIMI